MKRKPAPQAGPAEEFADEVDALSNTSTGPEVSSPQHLLAAMGRPSGSLFDLRPAELSPASAPPDPRYAGGIWLMRMPHETLH